MKCIWILIRLICFRYAIFPLLSTPAKLLTKWINCAMAFKGGFSQYILSFIVCTIYICSISGAENNKGKIKSKLYCRKKQVILSDISNLPFFSQHRWYFFFFNNLNLFFFLLFPFMLNLNVGKNYGTDID